MICLSNGIFQKIICDSLQFQLVSCTVTHTIITECPAMNAYSNGTSASLCQVARFDLPYIIVLARLRSSASTGLIPGGSFCTGGSCTSSACPDS